MKRLLILLSIIFFMLNLTAYCITSTSASMKYKQQVEKIQSSGILYKNKECGFSLIFPNYWKGKYLITINKNENTCTYINIQNKANMKKLGQSNIFTIAFFRSLYIWNTVGKSLRTAVGVRQIYKDGKQIFAVVYPSDVEYSVNDKKLHDEYFRMSKDINTIIKSFKRIK